jgi:DNA-binding MurR/RpiR family transcriptional regulator
LRQRIHYRYIRGMTDNDYAESPTPDNEQNATLFVKITEALDADLSEAAKRTGVSKSGIVRMALPLGLIRLQEQLQQGVAAQ